jgi:hypothetical protein
MGSERDLQWHCDAQFAAWLTPRLAGADVVHAHMFGAWWAAARAVGDGVPLIASEHNGYAWRGETPWEAMAGAAGRVDRFYAHGPDARAGALRPDRRDRPDDRPAAGADHRRRCDAR